MKAQFLFDIQAFITFEEIPLELAFNCDHTGIHYVPESNWTLEKERTKRIEIIMDISITPNNNGYS